MRTLAAADPPRLEPPAAPGHAGDAGRARGTRNPQRPWAGPQLLCAAGDSGGLHTHASQAQRSGHSSELEPARPAAPGDRTAFSLWRGHKEQALTYRPEEARGEGEGPTASRTRATSCGGRRIAPKRLGTRSTERVLWGKSHCRTRQNKKPGQVRTRWNYEQGSEGLQTPRRSEDEARKGRVRVRSRRSVSAKAEPKAGSAVSCRLGHSVQDLRAHVW